jgi:hypothetical protein
MLEAEPARIVGFVVISLFGFCFSTLMKVCLCVCVCVCVCVFKKLFLQDPGIVNRDKRLLKVLWTIQVEMLRKFQIQFKAHLCEYGS